MRFKAKLKGRASIPNDRCVILDHLRLYGVDYSGREFMQFGTIGCRLESCRFNNVRIQTVQFGSGREPSEFVECSFDGAHMEMGSGGYSRFVRCSFQDVELRNWICLEVEMIDCVFSGRMQRAVFNGAVRPENQALLGRDRNEFRGNDFSKLDLIDVGFRTGIDLKLQRLPSGPPYLSIPHPENALAHARKMLTGWGDPEERRAALTMIKSLEEEVAMGQRQLFLRADDYYEVSSLPHAAVDKVLALLGDKAG